MDGQLVAVDQEKMLHFVESQREDGGKSLHHSLHLHLVYIAHEIVWKLEVL
jgi:hypothetical protein